MDQPRREAAGIEWAHVFGDLRAAGVSHRVVAARIGRSEATVRDWVRGKEPRYDTGEQVLGLWLELAGLEGGPPRVETGRL